MRMSAHKKFVLELRAPVERYETRSAAGCKPGTPGKMTLVRC